MTPTAERVHKFICQFQVQHGVTPTRREIRKAFGRNAGGIRREQIVSKQAFAYADAMLKARKERSNG